MELTLFSLPVLWGQLVLPLLRLLLFIAIGLLAANLLESLNWTGKIALVARPLIRLGHFTEHVGAAFAMALVSGVAANTMLAEAYERGDIDKKELVLANLFNSLPTYFLHLPTMIVITLPLIKGAAFIYVGITFLAALLRTLTIVGIGRLLLPPPKQRVVLSMAPEKEQDWRQRRQKIWRRFKKRMKTIALFTVPIYIVIFIMNRLAFFDYLEQRVGSMLDFLPWLSPQAIGIITLHLAAELTAGLAAAGALLQDNILSYREIVFALLIGNILSSPLRAVRHQFPYYAGIFQPKLAVELIVYNQLFRVVSLIIAAACYIALTAS